NRNQLIYVLHIHIFEGDFQNVSFCFCFFWLRYFYGFRFYILFGWQLVPSGPYRCFGKGVLLGFLCLEKMTENCSKDKEDNKENNTFHQITCSYPVFR